MKKLYAMICLVFIMSLPSTSFALLGLVEIEAAIGGWYVGPSGDMKYNAPSDSKFKDVLGFDEETFPMGRVKLDLPILPVMYLMATPMEFKGNSKKGFSFKNHDFSSGAGTKLTLDHADLSFYYGVPLVGLVTLGTVHINGGLNVRVYDVKAEMKEAGTEKTVEKTIPLPMLYLSADISPTDAFAIEGEIRALSVGYGSTFSAIARLKLKVFGPVFVAGGYRYDKVSLDKGDFEADFEVSGPFAEAGFSF